MTENAYMTDGVCLAMTTKVIKVIHTMPYIEWNIRCCVLEIFDGFGYHISVLRALELWESAKKIQWKERVICPTWNRPTASLLQIKTIKALRLPSRFFGDHHFWKAQWTNILLSMLVLHVFEPLHRELDKVTFVHAIWIHVVSYHFLPGARRYQIFLRPVKNSKQRH